ncbi:hypothetical protein [Clostridium frigidicarnis]|uniref:DUF5105 domain-containing protein n=1 Tax=Clostridium frigidicarnis TaxID=84698 RepID=A0A1I0VUQ6_9CLOT|nr:hypothetical protein [Clostridium frigidicarnis]SFA79767.1 hypothetical protein SAMN04488528_100324 [Clostridium frigidicarnis]
MKSLKKISLLAVMCLSLLFVACGKPSEKELTECLNGSIQCSAGYEYDYGDISKAGSREEYDKNMAIDKQKAYKSLESLGIPFTKDQKDRIYNAFIANTKKITYEIKCDEIKDKTASFTVTSKAIDTDSFSKQLESKVTEKSKTAHSQEALSEDITKIIIDCYNNAPVKDSTNKAVFEKQDNVWKLTTKADDLTKILVD